jgi:hypothetical protein
VKTETPYLLLVFLIMDLLMLTAPEASPKTLSTLIAGSHSPQLASMAVSVQESTVQFAATPGRETLVPELYASTYWLKPLPVMLTMPFAQLAEVIFTAGMMERLTGVYPARPVTAEKITQFQHVMNEIPVRPHF